MTNLKCCHLEVDTDHTRLENSANRPIRSQSCMTSRSCGGKNFVIADQGQSCCRECTNLDSKTENEIETLQNAIFTLTSHFTKMKQQLEKITNYSTSEQQELLRELERASCKGLKDKQAQGDLPSLLCDVRSMGDIHVKQRSIITELRSHLEDITDSNTICFDTGEGRCSTEANLMGDIQVNEVTQKSGTGGMCCACSEKVKVDENIPKSRGLSCNCNEGFVEIYNNKNRPKQRSRSDAKNKIEMRNINEKSKTNDAACRDKKTIERRGTKSSSILDRKSSKSTSSRFITNSLKAKETQSCSAQKNNQKPATPKQKPLDISKDDKSKKKSKSWAPFKRRTTILVEDEYGQLVLLETIPTHFVLPNPIVIKSKHLLANEIEGNAKQKNKSKHRIPNTKPQSKVMQEKADKPIVTKVKRTGKTIKTKEVKKTSAKPREREMFKERGKSKEWEKTREREKPEENKKPRRFLKTVINQPNSKTLLEYDKCCSLLVHELHIDQSMGTSESEAYCELQKDKGSRDRKHRPSTKRKQNVHKSKSYSSFIGVKEVENKRKAKTAREDTDTASEFDYKSIPSQWKKQKWLPKKHPIGTEESKWYVDINKSESKKNEKKYKPFRSKSAYYETRSSQNVQIIVPNKLTRRSEKSRYPKMIYKNTLHASTDRDVRLRNPFGIIQNPTYEIQATSRSDGSNEMTSFQCAWQKRKKSSNGKAVKHFSCEKQKGKGTSRQEKSRTSLRKR